MAGPESTIAAAAAPLHAAEENNAMADFADSWPAAAREWLDSLDTPAKVQTYLDETPYSTEPIYRSPLSVWRDRRAHCFDGALFAAAAFARHGMPPTIVDLRAWNDDDHVIAVFRRRGLWGAVAKSNTVGLRYREPLYRSLRELTLSYFDFYFNLDSIKSLREWSNPVDLRAFEAIAWHSCDDRLDAIASRLDEVRHHPIVTAQQIAELAPVDRRMYDACLMGADEAGLFKPA